MGVRITRRRLVGALVVVAVAAVGGTVEAGNDPAGGYRVLACVPTPR